jgi:hypothetical protein
MRISAVARDPSRTRACLGILAIGLVGSLFGGCEEDARTAADKRLDTELVRTLNHIGIENAIITQHTLYPYHFVPNGEQLNELGQRDFAVLARHFADHPGLLNIRQAENVPPERHQARVAHVTSRLKEAGIEPGRVTLSDGMPGGPGMRAEQVVTILQKPVELSNQSTSRGTITR